MQKNKTKDAVRDLPPLTAIHQVLVLIIAKTEASRLYVMSVNHQTILRVDSSMRHGGSISRLLADATVSELHKNLSNSTVLLRDLTTGVGHVSSAWREARIEAPKSRSAEDRALLAQSEALGAEAEGADIIVLAVPIYNFSIPAALKAWVDMVCRNNVDGATAQTKPSPKKPKHAIVLLTSNHTLAGANDDFASEFLKFILIFIGCTEINVVDATGLANDKASVLANAHEKIRSICQAVASHEIYAAAE